MLSRQDLRKQNGLKLTQINNATCIYEAQGFKLLCDPWLTDGAFEGAWMHYPPLSTRFADIGNADALYISHAHPDHFDEAVLSSFQQQKHDIPVFILDSKFPFLEIKLKSLGFTNITKTADGNSVTIGPFEVTFYAPFVKHPFDNSELGNFLDSAIVVETNGKVVLNANDNTPTVETAEFLKSRHGEFTVAQLKDSTAGPYPSCFSNLSPERKSNETRRLVDRQIAAMCDVANKLEAEWFQPFAGNYQLGGNLTEKNQFLAVSAKQYSAWRILDRGLKPLVLNEGGSIDLITGELIQPIYKDIEPFLSWQERVSRIPYSYQLDDKAELTELSSLAEKARANLWKWQERFSFKPDYKIQIQLVSGCWFCFNLNSDKIKPFLEFDIQIKMDNRLLKRIMLKTAHYNNAEVGCHIDFDRKGEYNPDVHAIMSFFHI